MDRATVHDLASAAGVSLATVDRVLIRRAAAAATLADALRSERVFLSIVEVPPFDGEALDRLRNQPLTGVAAVATDHAPVRLADGLPFDAAQQRICIDIYMRDNVP
jgi:hypothetical protein